MKTGITASQLSPLAVVVLRERPFLVTRVQVGRRCRLRTGDGSAPGRVFRFFTGTRVAGVAATAIGSLGYGGCRRNHER